MAIFYKQFLHSRTVFCLVFSIFCLTAVFEGQSAMAENSIFTVSNVKVDVTAKDALQARNQAFEKAQIKAFKVLVGRILSESEAETMEVPVTMVISNLIQDYEVTNEKLSAVRYIGTYTFRFKDNEVKRYFSGRNAAYTDVSSNPVLALPFWQAPQGALLWSPYNVWLTAWNRATGLNGLVPITVPIGDLADVRDISDGEALNYERSKLRHMLRRYNASEAVILIAQPDQELSRVRTDSDTAAGRLYIQIYRTDRSEPELVQKFDVFAHGAETRAAFLDRAVKAVQQALQKDWKQKTIVETRQVNRLRVRVHVKNLRQWAEMQTALKAVSGIDKVELQSLSPKFAQVDLFYQGTLERLRLALKQGAMSLETPVAEAQEPKSAMSRYSIDRFLSGNYSREKKASYDLYLDKYRPAPTEPMNGISSQSGSRGNPASAPASAYNYHFKPQPKNAYQARYPGRYVPQQAQENVPSPRGFQADF